MMLKDQDPLHTMHTPPGPPLSRGWDVKLLSGAGFPREIGQAGRFVG